MIRINLIPPEELESHLWWVGDIIIAIIISVIMFFGSQFYLTGTKSQIEKTSKEIVAMEIQLNNLNKYVNEYRSINNEIKSYNAKLSSLKVISLSKVARYSPIIAIEHIQNLKPYGLWFNKLELKTSKDSQSKVSNQSSSITPSIIIEGEAIDSMLISEFITALNSTYYNAYDSQDIRTHIYFSNLKLVSINVKDLHYSSTTSAVKGYSFKLFLNFIERQSGNNQMPLALDDATVKFLEKTTPKNFKVGH